MSETQNAKRYTPLPKNQQYKPESALHRFFITKGCFWQMVIMGIIAILVLIVIIIMSLQTHGSPSYNLTATALALF